MNALKGRFGLALLVAAVSPWEARAVSKDVEALLKIMPGDVALCAVVPNAEAFDARLAEAMKQLDPSAEAPGLVDQLKGKVKLGSWVDFSKPIGLAQSDFSNDDTVLIYAVAPDFADKAKQLAGANQESGVWQLPFDAETTVFAVQKGDYVIAGKRQPLVAAALSTTPSLSDNLGPRTALLDAKQVFVEVNFEPIRPMALGGVMQLSALAPMIAMSAAANGSMDPTAINGLVTTGADGLQKFVEQVAFVDIALGIESGALEATIQPTFNDGPVKQYLSKQKSGTGFFQGAATDSYMVAFEWQFPGDTSPFLDYLIGKIEAAGAMPSPLMAQQPGGDDAKASAEAKAKEVKESLRATRKLFTAMEGMNLVYSLSPTGMVATGDYRGKDPAELSRLAGESHAGSNPLSKLFGLGADVQPSGSRKIGDIDVTELALTFDPSKGQTAMAGAIFGTNVRMTMGVVGDRVRYCLGSQERADAFFDAKSGATMDPNLAALLKKLPSRKNVVLAVNLGSIFEMVAMTRGGEAGMAAPMAGPPIGLSMSLSGEARIDLYAPLTAIKPLLVAGGGGPM